MTKSSSFLALTGKLALGSLLGFALVNAPVYAQENAQPAQEISPEQMAQFQQQMAAQMEMQRRYTAALEKLENQTAEEEAALQKQIALLFAREVASFGFNEQEQKAFVKNLEEGLAQNLEIEADEETQMLLAIYLQKRIESVQEQKQTKLFDEKLGAAKNLVTTESGLKYEVVTEGTGDAPKANSVIVLNYKGSLPDGTVFDSTERHGEPAEFDLSNPLIPGFTEGVLTIKKGGTSILYIPAELAYGSNPPPNSPIPANCPLIFEVELLDVK